MSQSGALSRYQEVGTQCGVSYADPHRLVQMLMDGAMQRIAQAQGAFSRGDVAGRGEYISKAIGLVGGLRESLNRERGGELAANLDALYDYLARRLYQANREQDPAPLFEVAGLLGEIRSAWEAIPPGARDPDRLPERPSAGPSAPAHSPE